MACHNPLLFKVLRHGTPPALKQGMDRPLDPGEIQRRTRRRWITGALAGAAVLALVLFLPGWVKPSIPRTEIRTAVVEAGPIDATLTASGLVVPEHEFVVTSPVDSRVVGTVHEAGDTVAAGEPIVNLDVTETRLLLERLEREVALKDNERSQARVDLESKLNELTGRQGIKQLELESLRFETERNEKLEADGVISGDDVRKSKADLERCRIELDQLAAERANAEKGLQVRLKALDLEYEILEKERDDAARTLARSSASSAEAGVVTWVLPGVGVAVSRGDELARVADLSTFKVEATISDAYAPRIRAGQPVLVKAGDLELGGSVAKVLPKVDNGIVRLDVALDEPAHRLLRPSLRVDVHVITDHRDRTLTVKRGSLVSLDGDYAVFRIRGEEAVRRPVKLGIMNFDRCEILEGLDAGDEIILSDMSDYANRKEIRIK